MTREHLRLALRAAGLSSTRSEQALAAQHAAAAAAAATAAAAAVVPDNGDGDGSGRGGGGGGNDHDDHDDHAHDHGHDHDHDHDDDHHHDDHHHGDNDADVDEDDNGSKSNDDEDEQVEEEVSTRNAQPACGRGFLPSYTFAGARMQMHTRRTDAPHVLYYTHAHTLARTHLRTYARTHLRTHAHTRARTHACTHARTHAHVRISFVLRTPSRTTQQRGWRQHRSKRSPFSRRRLRRWLRTGRSGPAAVVAPARLLLRRRRVISKDTRFRSRSRTCAHLINSLIVCSLLYLFKQ